jgi:hypothetical protein
VGGVEVVEGKGRNEGGRGLTGRESNIPGNSITLSKLFRTLSDIKAVMPESKMLGASVTTRIP